MTGTFVPANAVPARPRPADSGEDRIRVAGRVIDPLGQAAAGVEVLVVRYHWQTWEENPPVAKTKTDAAGHFQLEFRKSQLPESEYRGWRHALIAAVAPGFGPAWVKYEDIPAGKDVELRLVKDEPIAGRVVDLEGRPVRDVQVVVQNLRGNKKNDLTQWLDEVRAASAAATSRGNVADLCLRCRFAAQIRRASRDGIVRPERCPAHGRRPPALPCENRCRRAFPHHRRWA